jgi:hypothetical protein
MRWLASLGLSANLLQRERSSGRAAQMIACPWAGFERQE